MIEEKEDLLKQYFQISKTMHDALVQGKDDDFFSLLEKRETIITAIDQLDRTAGSQLINDRIEQLLKLQLKVELEIQRELQNSLGKMAKQVRFAQNETFLTKQYEGNIPVSKGVFYDQKK
jgi:predicted KAP-like P-loop ATPase